jgi:transcriptional regulator with XRE-family HTH domain
MSQAARRNKEKGLTFKRVERECGLGNGTIKRWETQSPRLEGLLKVSEYLHASLEELVFGSSEMETSYNDIQLSNSILKEGSKYSSQMICDGLPLSEAEADLIAMYRLLENYDQKTIFDLTKLKYEQITGEKESIYSTYTDVQDYSQDYPQNDHSHRRYAKGGA